MSCSQNLAWEQDHGGHHGINHDGLISAWENVLVLATTWHGVDQAMDQGI
jgi:hypothetical protein